MEIVAEVFQIFGVSMMRFFVYTLLICVACGYHHFPIKFVKKTSLLNDLRQAKIDSVVVDDTGNATGHLPNEIRNHQCINNMVLLERISLPEKTDAGIFLPLSEHKDHKHVGKVLSMPVTDNIGSYQVGDYVFIQDPWGIGPLDIQVGKRCFSFQKEDHISGVIKE